jgi:hypothetical protein
MGEEGMNESNISTDRRSFLKTGALVATPLVAAVPAAALADDGSRAKLARLEDERAIVALHRKFLQHVNGTGDCAEFIASTDTVKLDQGLRSIAEDLSHDAMIELSDDGLTARAHHLCKVELETEFTGDTTVEQMARFQGQGSHRHSEERVLATEYVKGNHGWRIASARFA